MCKVGKKQKGDARDFHDWGLLGRAGEHATYVRRRPVPRKPDLILWHCGGRRGLLKLQSWGDIFAFLLEFHTRGGVVAVCSGTCSNYQLWVSSSPPPIAARSRLGLTQRERETELSLSLMIRT